jgi:hypothetical protein
MMMTEDLEARLRREFAADATTVAPPAPDLAARARATAGPGGGGIRPGWRALAAAAVAVGLFAAGATVWLRPGDDDPPVTVVAGNGFAPERPGAVELLPSSGWRPGDDAGDGGLRGTLVVDPQGCVTLGPVPGDTVPVIGSVGLLWPAGYAVRRDRDGRVSILDGDGNVVLREGDVVALGGPGGSAGQKPENACPKDATATFAMGAFPRKVG